MKTTLCAVVLIAVLFSGLVVSNASAQGEKAAAGVTIAEAKLGTGIADKNISGESATFSPGEKVYVWMKTKGGVGDSVTVVWKQESFSHTTKLVIGGSPWRTWSYKTASKSGDWTVTISDREGKVLKELAFKVESISPAK